MAGWTRPLLAVLVSMAMLGAAACSDSPRGTATTTPSPDPGGSAVAGVPAPDADGDGVTDAQDACPEQKEDQRWTAQSDGCPDTLADLMTLAEQDVDGFWQRTSAQLRAQYTPPAKVEGYTSAVETGCGEAVPQNAFYCSRDHSIYFDDGLMQTLLDEIGDYGPVFVLAHEWGHLVQAELGILQGANFTIQLELQADCFGGAYTRDAESRQVLEEGDLDEAVKGLIVAGDPRGVPWFAPGAHGTAEQRLDAFAAGYEGGVGACL